MRKPTYLFVLHTSHAGLFMVLFATALLLLFPDLRARLVGGYSRMLRDLHLWFGFASILTPFAVLVGARRLPKMPPWRITGWWGGVHVRYTYLITFFFAASGLVMWQPDYFSAGLGDSMLLAHEWLTYAVAGVLGLHITLVAGKRVAVLYRRARGRRWERQGINKDQIRAKAWSEEEGLRRALGGQRWR